MITSILFHAQSAAVLTLLYVGVAYRHDQKRHVPIMLTAIIWDVLLILQIELTRGAIERALGFNTLILRIHVPIAVSVVLLYGVLVYLGRRLRAGDESVRKRHRSIGILTLVLRTITLMTSYFVGH